ncbi:hypothetical protein [Aeromonas phage phiWae14]|nr:hypothetical protein [Aeromonas phage phiWae14]
MTEQPMNAEVHDEIETEIKERQEKVLRELAEKRAKKHLAKNAREIERLKQHAEECLHVCNKDGYIYAISKLRKITMQSVLDKDVLESLWMSSKQRYDELVVEAYKQVNKIEPATSGEESKGALIPVCSV